MGAQDWGGNKRQKVECVQWHSVETGKMVRRADDVMLGVLL